MPAKDIKRRVIAVSMAATLAAVPLLLTGCMGSSSSSNANSNVIQVSRTTHVIQQNAVNNMVNGALKFTVTDMQRRPMSIFSGSSISSASSSSSSSSQVTSASTTDIVVQIDVSFTWNVNTYSSALTAAGVQMNKEPSTLSELLQPGSLMVVQGEDADGNLYQSTDVISPAAQSDINQLAINSQWDYDVMNSDLPETSVTKQGSFLIRVPSTAKNLKLILVTPNSGQDVTQPDDVTSTGNVDVYELPLT